MQTIQSFHQLRRNLMVARMQQNADMAFGQHLHGIEQHRRNLIVHSQHCGDLALHGENQTIFRHLARQNAALRHKVHAAEQDLQTADLAADPAAGIAHDMVCHERCAIAGAHLLCEHMPEGGIACKRCRIRQCSRVIQLAAQLQPLQCD